VLLERIQEGGQPPVPPAVLDIIQDQARKDVRYALLEVTVVRLQA